MRRRGRGRVALLPRHRRPGSARRTVASATPTRLGFYSGRQIQGLAPLIRDVVASVPLTAEDAATRALSADPVERRVGEALAAALHDGATSPRVSVVLLSPPDDPDTASFEPVTHDADAAWTMFQRFADLDRLRTATSTADLGSG